MTCRNERLCMALNGWCPSCHCNGDAILHNVTRGETSESIACSHHVDIKDFWRINKLIDVPIGYDAIICECYCKQIREVACG